MPENEEGMNKYAVVTNDSHTKEASEGGTVEVVCPLCGETCDSGGACPEHGTRPFEPGGQGD